MLMLKSLIQFDDHMITNKESFRLMIKHDEEIKIVRKKIGIIRRTFGRRMLDRSNVI